MLGHRPNWYWKIMWAGTSPLLLIALFIFYIINYIQGGTPSYQAWNKELVSYGVFHYFLPNCFSVSKLVQLCADTEVKLGQSQVCFLSPSCNQSALAPYLQRCHFWCKRPALNFCLN